MHVGKIAVALWLVAASPVLANDHPFAGIWGEASQAEAEESPEFFGQDGCYNKFTEQRPDGSFRFFLVDHAKWLKDRKIEYLLAQEGTCTMNASGKSEKCVGTVVGETENEWFIVYPKEEETSLPAIYYENVFYFEKGFNGVRLTRHRCPFDMAEIKPYITGRTITDCTERCRAFALSEEKQFREMVDTIKAKQ